MLNVESLKNLYRQAGLLIIIAISGQAEVWVDGQNLGKLLIDNGLAKPYDGGKKQKWGVNR